MSEAYEIQCHRLRDELREATARAQIAEKRVRELDWCNKTADAIIDSNQYVISAKSDQVDRLARVIIAPWTSPEHEPAKPHPLIFGNSIVGNEPVPKSPEDTRPVLRISQWALDNRDYAKNLKQACDQQGIKLEII